MGLIRLATCTPNFDRCIEWQQVMILGYTRTKWCIDLLLGKVAGYWKLWCYGNKPLVRLSRMGSRRIHVEGLVHFL
jgi:hypothetical protein